MAKGIIVLDEIPNNCFHCRLKKRPAGMSFPEDMICVVTGQSVYQYKPHNIYGTKPDWCPIRPIYSDDADSVNSDKESVILSPKDMIKLLERTPDDDILMVETNNGNDESGVVEDVCIGSGTSKGFTYIKVSTDI